VLASAEQFQRGVIEFGLILLVLTHRAFTIKIGAEVLTFGECKDGGLVTAVGLRSCVNL
jgi:hypothetical protein